MDLDITNYDYDDILKLFKVGQNFNEEDLKKAFDKYGLSNLTFYYSNNVLRYGFGKNKDKEATEVTIEFDSNSYNGRVSNSVEELFELICNRFGFESYDYTSGDYKVTFYV